VEKKGFPPLLPQLYEKPCLAVLEEKTKAVNMGVKTGVKES